MKLNQPITNGTNGATSEFLREMADMEHEDEPKASFDYVDEVEKLCTLELIKIMRDVRHSSRAMDELARERFAKRFEQLSLEATAACAWLRRFRADTNALPEFLREHGQI